MSSDPANPQAPSEEPVPAIQPPITSSRPSNPSPISSTININPLDLTFESALTDSPQFRAVLQRHEDEFEEFGKWLELVCRYIRTFLEDFSSALYLIGKWII